MNMKKATISKPRNTSGNVVVSWTMIYREKIDEAIKHLTKHGPRWEISRERGAEVNWRRGNVDWRNLEDATNEVILAVSSLENNVLTSEEMIKAEFSVHASLHFNF